MGGHSKYRGSALPSATCTRIHFGGGLGIAVLTFLFTRYLDQTLGTSNSSNFSYDASRLDVSDVTTAGLFRWPEQGYGSHLGLKIYVYEEDEVEGLKELLYGRDHSITSDFCVTGQWGMQVKIHYLLLKSKYRTMNKDEAQLFFVPSYVKCVRMKGGLNDKEINETYVKVLQQLPFFRRSGGRDHIFIFPSGAGAHLFKSWSVYLNRSIFLTPEGDRTDKRGITAFNTWKDIIVPGNVDDSIAFQHSAKASEIKPIPLSKRKYLANYLGRAQGKAGRVKLIELSKQFPDKLEAPNLKFSGPQKLGRKEYFQHLRNAKFCLAPRGESSWTLRFYEAFFVECVPVILSDQIELPFQNVLDYSQFSIKWPATSIGLELLEYLESITDEEIETMIARGQQVRCLWIYTVDNLGFSAMTGILWELQRKVRHFHQSAETFWLHNGSIVNREFIPFKKWRAPMPLP
eukprot:TRINITY_DN32977_c0_g1_i1.p1 TRINITY_DN32977_c0_g1~~TRINITY_DN32977_c0_g1_i1.p1  ORF type:complete len:459 (+),score=57.24 TRINITY_DN32977_c0_g1_i1:257-1633(+)